MNLNPIYPILGEDLSFLEEFAAHFSHFPRQTLRPDECERSSVRMIGWGEDGTPGLSQSET
ncbi:MAG TPA: hypothetical protein VFI65_26300 [Streptosporangiaceae bacterium]|nr:hypothetical protein [Streptosporangiaceae bacterium]